MLQRSGQNPNADNYRYGFQGQEEDNEVKGDGSGKRNGNSVNYRFRMHDPRLGRFFAVDPLTAKYPHYTPYSFSGNKTVAHVELEGLEEYYYTLKFDDDGKAIWKVIRATSAWWSPDIISVDVPQFGVRYSFTRFGDAYNLFDDFENGFAKDPLVAMNSGKYTTNGDILSGTAQEVLYMLLTRRAHKVNKPKAKSSNDFKIKKKTIPSVSNSKPFKAPKVYVDKQGLKTNGKYRVSEDGMKKHTNGDHTKGSQFKYGIDADKAVLDAAAYADENNLWKASSGEGFKDKAKVPVVDGDVGYSSGKPTKYITVHRTKQNLVHGNPANPPKKKI